MGNRVRRLGGFIRRTRVPHPQGNGASFLCSDTQANSPKKDAPSPCYPNAGLIPECGLFNRGATVVQPQGNGASFLCSDTQANSPKKDAPSPCYPNVGKTARLGRIFLLLVLLAGLMAACGSGGGDAQERLVDIHYGATPTSSDANTFVCGQRLSALPGEKIRFRVYNHTDDDLEFIVTDEEGADLRRQELQPGLRIIPASLSATGPAGAGPDSIVSAGTVPAGTVPAGTKPASLSASGEMAHAGHDDEVWPDATQDYRYRFIVDPAFGDRPNVRNELVTFPDATEDYVLSRYICAHPDFLDKLTISSISRR